MRSSKNGFIRQGGGGGGEFLRGIHRYKFGPPKNSSGANSSDANDFIVIDHVLCLSHGFLLFELLSSEFLSHGCSLLFELISSKLRCLRLKIQLLVF